MSSNIEISTTQLGAIGENIVASYLILASEGRLSPFKPIADDSGIDLLIYDKLTGCAVPLQVKIRTRTLSRHLNHAHFQVREATFNEEQHAYLLAVLFESDTLPLVIQRAWLIPMNEVRSVSRKQGDNLVLRPNYSSRSADRYTRYRCEGINEVANRLITGFEADMSDVMAAGTLIDTNSVIVEYLEGTDGNH